MFHLLLIQYTSNMRGVKLVDLEDISFDIIKQTFYQRYNQDQNKFLRAQPSLPCFFASYDRHVELQLSRIMFNKD